MLAAWAWLKKYWELVLGGLLIFVGFLFGVSVRKRPVLVQGEDPNKKKVENETKEAIAEAVAVRDEKKADAAEAYDKALAQEIEQERETVPGLATDTDATNEYLKQIGKKVRGDDKG